MAPRIVYKFYDFVRDFKKAIVLKISGMPDFDHIDYQYAVPPASYKLRAWIKFKECERRLVMYKWVESLNYIGNPKFKTLLNDSVSAFLLSLEGTLQILADQVWETSKSPGSELGNWLNKLPFYDVTIKGLRTLRHFEAHVEPKQTQQVFHFEVTMGSTVPKKRKIATPTSANWRLPTLDATQLARLATSPLKTTGINDWNTLVRNNDVSTILCNAMSTMKTILDNAETLV